MMWWALWCALVVAGSAGTLAAPASNALAPLTPGDWAQADPAGPDDDNYGYAMASMGGKYAAAPWFYLLTDLPHDSQVAKREDNARKRLPRAFSVNPAADALQRGAYNNYRERLALVNRDFLNCIGKRDPWSGLDCNVKN